MKRARIGFMYQPTYRDRKTGELRYSPTWWISISRRKQKRLRLSSDSENPADATRLLKKKIAELGLGKVVNVDIEKTTLADLEQMLRANYVKKGNKSIGGLEPRFRQWRAFFGADCRAIEIDSARIEAFMAARIEEGAARGTVNIEATLLRRAFRVARKGGRVVNVPDIELTNPRNTRKGYFEREQFEAVMRHLPEELRPVVHVAYLTGWRLKSELLTRKRQHLDLQDGWLRLEPGETKSGEGRNFPLTVELRGVLEAQVAKIRTMERESGRIIPWLFPWNDGLPIKNFTRSWRTACLKAGVPGRLRHDFRRTAVRNLERQGVSRSAAMEMVGHATEAIYRRYAIGGKAALKEAALKIDAAQMSTKENESKHENQSKLSQSNGLKAGKL